MPRLQLFRIGGPVFGSLAYVLMRHHGDQPAIMAGLVAWMAVWWISEAVPLPVTSILPLIVYPLFGIDTVAATAANYGREIIFLFLGGFIIALGIEKSGAHKRIALHIVSFIGGSPSRIVLGMMVACAVLSMWINSTATALVMLPIALSLLDDEDAPLAVRQRMTIPLLLGVAYGSTIGGMATPVGTPPNLILIEFLRLSDLPAIGFAQWMSFGVPVAAIYLALGWLVITRIAFNVGTARLGEQDSVNARLRALGKPRKDEVRALVVFSVVALAWITGDDLQLSEESSISGWRTLTGFTAVTDAAIAVLGAIVLFLIPSAERDPELDRKKEGTALMSWPFAEARVPWGVLLLLGGGFALAAGVDHSGLAAIISEAMSGLGALSPVLLIGAIVLIVCVLSELGSNSATASLVIPIVATMATQWHLEPGDLLIPATLGASLGFMLPVASPMQTLVFGTGRIPVRQMVRAGAWMDAIGII
ncbi:MAG: SLC13 family permease, partial [Bacteroidota bacterium]|nr:SLC13 family permease [Bacteroidota bacterium]